MTKVLVLYLFRYGHIETMANAVAEAPAKPGATVDIKRVPELGGGCRQSLITTRLDQAAPVPRSKTSPIYDAIHRRHRHPLSAAWRRRWPPDRGRRHLRRHAPEAGAGAEMMASVIGEVFDSWRPVLPDSPL